MTTYTIILDGVLPKRNAHKYKTERSVYTFYIHMYQLAIVVSQIYLLFTDLDKIQIIYNIFMLTMLTVCQLC